jgi:hypothetical protein
MDQLAACFDPSVERAAGGTVPAGSPSAAFPSAAPSDAVATLPLASGEGRAPTPGAVAIAPPDPSITEPPALPSQGAASASAPPGVPWPVLILAAVVLLAGFTVLVRPDLRAKIRSRTR